MTSTCSQAIIFVTSEKKFSVLLSKKWIYKTSDKVEDDRATVPRFYRQASDQSIVAYFDNKQASWKSIEHNPRFRILFWKLGLDIIKK